MNQPKIKNQLKAKLKVLPSKKPAIVVKPHHHCCCPECPTNKK
jgi:hypothetical protein